MENFSESVARLRACFHSHATRSADARLRALRTLAGALEAAEPEILAALKTDLGKSAVEGYLSDTGFVMSELRHAEKHLRRWMRGRRGRVPWMIRPGRAESVPEPLGVVLILAPWNYPVQLSLGPLVSAIAAGNCAVVKPSEHAPHTSAALARMIAGAFPPDFITVAEGGRETAEALLAEKWDHIFFTGSTAVGRRVSEAAARTLTPVTLELGGKSPCLVCADAPLEVTARRIIWGKCLNAGQTCVAPDYLLVDRRIRGPLVAEMRRALDQFFGGDASTGSDYGRIVHRAHFERLTALMKHGTVLHGGRHDAESRYIEPTLLGDVAANSPLMQEEIFGPLLPVVEFGELEEALAFIRARPHPLALYLFTGDRSIQQKVQQETASGGLCINDVLVHLMCRSLPFGGRGESGMGASHGKAGFDAFSHARTVLRRPFCLDFKLRYPPVRTGLALMKRLRRVLLGD